MPTRQSLKQTSSKMACTLEDVTDVHADTELDYDMYGYENTNSIALQSCEHQHSRKVTWESYCTCSSRHTACRSSMLLIGIGIATLAILGPFLIMKERSSTNATPMPNSPDSSSSTISTIEQIKARNAVKCIVLEHPIFAHRPFDDETVVGFDADLCRAVASAILGEPLVQFTLLQSSRSRFQVLANSGADLLVGLATHTMERDIREATTGIGFTFSTPYLYSGGRFGGQPLYVGCAENQTTTSFCESLRICVIDGSTSAMQAEQLFGRNGAIVPATGFEDLVSKFASGDCNVLFGEQTDVAEGVIRAGGYEGEYIVGTKTFPREPLAMVTRETDPIFSDLVNWVLHGVLTAEEKSITMETADLMGKSSLFRSDNMEDALIDAIGRIGNYAELYDRHLAPRISRMPINTINDGSSARVYAHPFGNTGIRGPSPKSGERIDTILKRGYLRCGVSRSLYFADRDPVEEKWSGMNIDFCQAVAAALFKGEIERTLVVVEVNDGLRFLDEGGIDVFAGVEIDFRKDVNEIKTGDGCSFSPPYFYGGATFAGISPYGKCADQMLFDDPECADLVICVEEGKPYQRILEEMLSNHEVPVVLRPAGTAISASLGTDCNAVFGSTLDVSNDVVRNVGGLNLEDDPSLIYEIGTSRFSRSPIGLATRQDKSDTQFSDFVYWIVMALFHAEEQGISVSNADEMPIVNLFGSLNPNMFRDAVRVVGHYGDIYFRTLEAHLPRGGLNLLNGNSNNNSTTTAQHYAFPGILG